MMEGGGGVCVRLGCPSPVPAPCHVPYLCPPTPTLTNLSTPSDMDGSPLPLP